MILQRLKAAFARQDWFAVAIECLLVVVGVLLGFQISEWASGRNERTVRREAIERLLHEAEQDVANLRELSTDHEQSVVAVMRRAAALMHNPTPTPAEAAVIRDAFARSRRLPKPFAPDSVYRELIASGRFGEIGDVAMRDAVSNFASSLAYLNQAIDYTRSTMTDELDGKVIKVRYNPASQRLSRTEVDFVRLAEDSQLQGTFLTRLSNQIFVVSNYAETLAAAEKMCREVARVARKPCRAPLSPSAK